MTNARTAKSAREKSAEMRAQAQRDQTRQRAVIVSAAVAAVIALVVVAVVIIRTASAEKAATTAASTPTNLVDGAMAVGKADAKVTIEAYEDFQCPACKSFEDANSEQLSTWIADGTVRVLFRPVAILDRFSSTEYSTRSLNAAAAVVSADPTAFEAFHKLLFANQPPENTAGLTDAQLIDYAVEAGVDRAAVESAITEQTYKPWTLKVTDEFSQKGFSGTPTVVVAGKKLEGFDPASLKTAVEAAAT